jgi:hypothetical protein
MNEFQPLGVLAVVGVGAAEPGVPVTGVEAVLPAVGVTVHPRRPSATNVNVRSAMLRFRIECFIRIASILFGRIVTTSFQLYFSAISAHSKHCSSDSNVQWIEVVPCKARALLFCEIFHIKCPDRRCFARINA